MLFILHDEHHKINYPKSYHILMPLRNVTCPAKEKVFRKLRQQKICKKLWLSEGGNAKKKYVVKSVSKVPKMVRAALTMGQRVLLHQAHWQQVLVAAEPSGSGAYWQRHCFQLYPIRNKRAKRSGEHFFLFVLASGAMLS